MKVQVLPTKNLPQYQTEGSSGADIHAANEEPITLGPLERALVPTNLYMAIPRGYEVVITPRSGLAAKHGITVLNTPGKLDSDWRGHTQVILVNLSNNPFTINPGDRIAQMSLLKVEQIEWEVVDSLNETGRSNKGFGSTGISQ